MELVVNPLDDQRVEVGLVGRLDTAGVDVAEMRFNAATVGSDRHSLVDLSEVTFVSSMGIRMLITAAKTARTRQRRLLMVVPPGPVRDVLTVAAIDSLIPMFESRDEALPHLLR